VRAELGYTSHVDDTRGRDLTLAVGDGFELPPLPIAITPRRLRATYHDTADHRLARRGVALRRRSEDGRDVWQLQLPAVADLAPLEWEADDSAVPPEAAALVRAYVRGRPLRPVADLHILRRSVRVTADGAPAAEIVHDSVDVLDGSRVVRSFAEVGVERIGAGGADVVARLERQLRAAGARRGDHRPAIGRALDLPAVERARPKRKAPAIEHLRAYLEAQVEALLRSDPATRRGGAEGVHGMRVATRRMRSVLKEARRLLDPVWVRETRAELAWLGGVLGEVRDADVFAAYAARALGDEGRELVRLIRERSLPARERLAAALDSPRYLALLDRLEAIAESLPIGPQGESPERMVRRAARRVRRRLRRVSATSPDADLHELRIAGKRARYAAELAAPATGPAARRFAARAAELQAILGDHQDAVVAEQQLALLAGEATPAAAFAAGRLAERQGERRRAARARLPKAARRLKRAADRL
jgi:CHAD domain-containing protein